MSLSEQVLKILNSIKKIVAGLARYKNAVSEDSKALVIILAFIGWIAVSNYKDKHGTSNADAQINSAPA
jgi:hypothetical protein